MKKTSITHLDLDLYTDILPNGLKVYIVPQKEIDNIYAIYATKFGAKVIDFKVGNKLYHVPYGVAHFLEHQLFERENGKSVHELFEKNGAYCNAFTGYDRTAYVFEAPNNFKENMEILINYVNNPCFTDKTVEKEKGIIIQELKKSLDNPYRNGINSLQKNMLKYHPMHNHILGTVGSISSITDNDLYSCYNTFYDPKNMFMVITGNVNPKEAIDVIKNNFHKKVHNNEVSIIQCNEPLKIHCKKEIIHMNVTIPKFFLGIKIDMNSYPLSHKKWCQYMYLYLDSLLSPTSDLADNLKESKIINDNIEYMVSFADNYMLVSIVVETKHLTKLEKILKENLGKKVDEKTFGRKKKCYLSSAIKRTDDIFGMNSLISNEIVHYGEFDSAYYDRIKELNYDDFTKLINAIDFTNTSTLYIKPIKEK